ncbi:MAPEG family protein [Nitratireductor sp. CAU 1489]|uniref:MAPEG family protein n=1 Tax=Nitratireductor arenosus TaxID=2682096 RepID=A0A844QNX7_9HYPH|nr:MAPEG family protein [Nitratireductor arenosus]MVA99673.1 MAPEG family protein [Nitratireductor arenosus]
MTTELFYLFLTSVLLAVVWIPFIYGQATHVGPLTPKEYVEGRHAEVPHWIRRADRAHLNLVEQYGAFAGLVLVAHLAGVHDAVTVWCTAIFFFARVAHAVIYVAGVSVLMARTVAFLVAFLALVVYAIDILVSFEWAAVSAA